MALAVHGRALVLVVGEHPVDRLHRRRDEVARRHVRHRLPTQVRAGCVTGGDVLDEVDVLLEELGQLVRTG